MQPRYVVVIGTSAGGIKALRELVCGLPGDFPAAVAIVVHTSPHSPGIVHEILARSGELPAVSPRNTERLRAGRLYVAPPDFHLLIEPGFVKIAKGPREKRFRPAIDPLFRSAAQVFGPNAIGVILTGNLDDGTAGLWAIKQLGGIAVVQDPSSALFPSMPQSAMNNVAVDYVSPLAGIAPLLIELTAASREAALPQVRDPMKVEATIAKSAAG